MPESNDMSRCPWCGAEFEIASDSVWQCGSWIDFVGSRRQSERCRAFCAGRDSVKAEPVDKPDRPGWYFRRLPDGREECVHVFVWRGGHLGYYSHFSDQPDNRVMLEWEDCSQWWRATPPEGF